LDIAEFTIAMHLIQSLMANQISAVPASLPQDLLQSASLTSPITSQFPQNGVRRTASVSSTGSGRTQQLPPQLPPKITQSPLQAQFTGQSQTADGWDVTPQDKLSFDALFKGIDTGNKGYIDGASLNHSTDSRQRGG
jgi:epidermal growth factor receptor substrate 15